MKKTEKAYYCSRCRLHWLYYPGLMDSICECGNKMIVVDMEVRKVPW